MKRGNQMYHNKILQHFTKNRNYSGTATIKKILGNKLV